MRWDLCPVASLSDEYTYRAFPTLSGELPMLTFTADLIRLCVILATIIASALALVLASGIMFTTLFLSILLLPYVTSIVVLLLFLHYAYQQYTTRYPSSSHEDEAYLYWLPCEDEVDLSTITDDQFERDYATSGTDCLNTPSSVQATYVQEELTRDGYCLLSMVPCYPVCDQEVSRHDDTIDLGDLLNTPAIAPVASLSYAGDKLDLRHVDSFIAPVCGSGTIGDAIDVYSILSDEQLLSMCKDKGVRGANKRWKRATLISRLQDTTPAQMVA